MLPMCLYQLSHCHSHRIALRFQGIGDGPAVFWMPVLTYFPFSEQAGDRNFESHNPAHKPIDVVRRCIG